MARRNSPLTLQLWSRLAAQAPYRASIDSKAHWDVARPAPDLAVASRVSPGGRLLMAFELQELRDYFVEGHADQGAQAEANGAEKASARRAKPVRSESRQMPMQQVFDGYVQAEKARGEADHLVFDVFNAEVQRLRTAGEGEKAVAIINSLPDGMARQKLVMQALDSGWWDREAKPMWKVPSAPYTRERAAALVVWQRAEKAYRTAAAILGAHVQPLVQGFVARGDRQGLTGLIEATPNSVEKAFMRDALRQLPPSELASESVV